MLQGSRVEPVPSPSFPALNIPRRWGISIYVFGKYEQSHKSDNSCIKSSPTVPHLWCPRVQRLNITISTFPCLKILRILGYLSLCGNYQQFHNSCSQNLVCPAHKVTTHTLRCPRVQELDPSLPRLPPCQAATEVFTMGGTPLRLHITPIKVPHTLKLPRSVK